MAFRLGASLDEAYMQVNNQLDEDLPDDRFITAFIGFLDLDKQEANQLLQYVHAGNDSFIATSNFGTYLADTLNIKVETQYSVKEDTVLIDLTNNSFSKQNYFHAFFSNV